MKKSAPVLVIGFLFVLMPLAHAASSAKGEAAAAVEYLGMKSWRAISGAAIRMFYGPAENGLRDMIASVAAENTQKPHLQIEKFLSPPEIDALQQPVSPPPVTGVSAFPSDENDWIEAFDRRPSNKDLSVAKEENQLMNSQIFNKTPQKFPGTIADFRTFLDATSSTIVTIVGHNDGGLFFVPPRNYLELEQMNDQCSRAMKVCVFLNCKAAKSEKVMVGSIRYLSVRDAAGLAQKVRRLSELAIDRNMNRMELLQAIVLMMQKTESAQGRRHVVILMGPLTGGGGVLAMVVAANQGVIIGPQSPNNQSSQSGSTR